MNQEPQATPFEEARAIFDGMTAKMAGISADKARAPVEHAAAYDAAWRACYGQAYGFLEQHPEIGRYYLDQTKETFDQAPALLREKQSLQRLQAYLNEGLLNEVDVTASEAVIAHWDKLEYIAQAYAFKELFAAAVVVEPVPVENELPEAEDEEEQDDPNRINALDVMELVEEHDFTDAEQALICHALSAYPINLSKLRRELFEIIAMPKTDFEALNKNFHAFRVRVVAFLRSAGIPADWKKGKVKDSYHLVIGREAERLAERDPKAGLRQMFGDNFDHRPDRQIYRTKAVVTVTGVPEVVETIQVTPHSTAELLERIRAHIAGQGQPPRLQHLGRLVAEEIGVSHAEACGFIQELVDAGSLFYGRRKGSRVVCLEPVALKRSSQNISELPGAGLEPEQAKQPLSPEEAATADRILRVLVHAGHQNRGSTVRTMSNELGVNEDELRPVINKLTSHGVVVRQRRWVRSRSPHSTKNESMYIQFTDQATWDRYKAAPRDFLQALTEVPSAL